MTPAPPSRTERLQAALAQLALDGYLSASGADVTYLTGSTEMPAAVWVPVSGTPTLVVPEARHAGAVAPEAYRVLPRPLGGSWAAPLSPLLPPGPRRLGTAGLHGELRGLAGSPCAPDLLDRLRRRHGPDAPERDGLARSRRIASAAARAALDAARPGVRETDVALAAESTMRLARAQPLHRVRLATGTRAADAGAGPSPRILREGDAGFVHVQPEWEGHRAVIARSFHLGPPSPDGQRLCDAMLRARDAALTAMRPGRTGGAVFRAAAASLEAAGLGGSCPHAMGRPIGGMRRPRLIPDETEALLPGDILILDVGVYVAGMGGLRVADAVQVTAGGAELLAGGLPAWTVVDG